RLEVDAAVADQHDRAELRIEARAERELSALGCEPRHDHAFKSFSQRNHLVALATEFRRWIGWVQRNETVVALVRHVGRAGFHHHRARKALDSADGILFRTAKRMLDHRDS